MFWLHFRVKWALLLCCLMLEAAVAFAHGTGKNESYFIPNKGQWPEQVIAHCDLQGLRIFIENDGITWLHASTLGLEAIHHDRDNPALFWMHAFQTKWANHSYSGKFRLEDRHETSLNYFLGNDPNAWATDIQPAHVLVLEEVYPGIDVRLMAHDGFKYEFVVSPGADIAPIKMKVEGVDFKLNKQGGIDYLSKNGVISEEAPVAWTEVNGQKQAVKVKYQAEKSFWSFDVGSYNRQTLLILDPTLVASTFSGAGYDNWGFTATYGANGDIYLGGIIFNPGYPTNLGAYQTTYGGFVDMTISRYNAQGTTQIYGTYLGGGARDEVLSLVTNAAGDLFLLGKVRSVDFPMGPSPYDNSQNGNLDLVVGRLSAAGNVLQASTYLGGSGNEGANSVDTQRFNAQVLEFNYGDDGRGEILLDAQGNVLVVSNTASPDFPMQQAFQPVYGGSQDGILAKLNPALSNLLYSTFLGGSEMDAAYGVRSISGDTVIVVGSTFSGNFPIVGLAEGHTRTQQGSCDGFLLRLRTASAPALSGTFLGTSTYDQAYLVDLDDSNRVYVAGITLGTWPITPANVYANPGAPHFIQRFSPNLGQLQISTAVGPSTAQGPCLSPTAFMIDVCRKIYLSGWGGTTNSQRNSLMSPLGGLPVTVDAFRGVTDGSDMYLLVLEENAQSVVYGTYFGGNTTSEHVDGGTSRFSKEGTIYHAVCAGCGGSSDFPTTPGAYSSTNNAGLGGGRCNAAVFKIDLGYVNPIAGFRTQYRDTTVCLNTPVQFNPTGTLFGDFFWDFGVPGATSTLRNPTYTYTSLGVFQVTLIIRTCIAADTVVQNVEVFPPPVVQLSGPPVVCLGDSLTLQASGGALYRWKRFPGMADTSGNNVRALANTSRWYVVTVTDIRGCISTDSIFVEVSNPRRVLQGLNNNWCFGDTLRVNPALSTFFTAANWLPDPDITNPGSLSQQFNSLPARWVYLQLTDSLGCTYRDSIFLNPSITVTANGGPDRFICSDDSITLTASGGTRYRWSTGDTTASIRFWAATNTRLWVETWLGSCRSLPDTVFILNARVEADFSFSPDTGYAPQEISFTNLSVPPGNLRSFWDFGDGNTSLLENPVHVYRTPGSYRIILRVQSKATNCSDTLVFDYVYIDSVALVLPNAFTPNGDGTNDVFIGLARNFRSLDFRVYDRWGSRVFNAVSTEIRWDGKCDGEPCIAGVYPYVLEGVGRNGRPYRFTGTINLIR
ncbi:MAG: hypothetical protein C0424_06365 [Sphingobacteriaceae bacterium]|nr:hypothetical protein [Sphingobacteriaceae bacterium]